MLKAWIQDLHGAVISRSIEHGTYRIKDLKTSRVGVTVKPMIFSEQLEWALPTLELRRALRDDLLFRTETVRPIGPETANEHFTRTQRSSRF